MSLQKTLMDKMKEAMKSKNTIALEALRAVKSATLLAKTESGNTEELTKEQEIKLLQKLVKQRKDSAALYKEQNREDLATPELQQAEVIAQFLPKPLSENELKSIISEIVEKAQATSMKDMGKVMSIASQQLAGKADGKSISTIVKQLLS